MPTYEYRCPKGHEFELFQKMSDQPVAECPECGKQAERLLSAGAGLLFKGSGFYITDYRNDSYKKAADRESGKKGGSEGGKSSEKGGKEPSGGSSAGGGSGSTGGSASGGGGASGGGKGGAGGGSSSGGGTAE